MKRSEMIQVIKDIIRETCDVKKGPRLGVALKVLKAIEEAGMLPPTESTWHSPVSYIWDKEEK